ncbi:ferric reductase-like transmembrane domain-containing protein [Rhodoluna sp.]|uniref:ferredoxin reductase family protein n=1 Tax=Rhodoluna sp. TaxID=1969481 RepID=UPI0025E97CDA|nr:ferric reductase-like transmembrane domain-containing protein [Rhodoluna sp.]
MNQQPLQLVTPNPRVRLGQRKVFVLKRAQDVIEAIAWASVVAVVVFFLIDGGIKGVTDLPTALNAISRLTALVGTDLLMIHMLLVARVPWIDKFYGHDKATLAHKKLGKPVLYFIVAHFLASLIQFSITNSQNVIATLVWLITDVQDMLTAVAALTLMILVVVTSLNFARRKMSYEAWFIVHLMSYAAVLLAVPHIFSTGSDIAGKPASTIFWVTLYLFVALNIVWYRAAKPLIRIFGSSMKIANVVRESSDTTSLYLRGKNIDKLGGASGQFYFLRVLTPRRWFKAHPFSLSAAPNNHYMRFTIGNRGDDTAFLQTIKPGTRVAVEGPFGVFTEERRTQEKVVLIASGIGIPPIRALAESMASRPGDITIIYRVRDEEDASLLAEVREIARIRGFRLYVLPGPRASLKSWMNNDGTNNPDLARLAVMAPWISESDVYICGPQIWTELVVSSCTRAGVPADRIHAEEFAW